MSVSINGVEYVPRIRIGAPKEMGTLGNALRVLRKGAKLSLAKAAVEVGCSKSYLWELEHDRTEPGLRVAANLASAYGVPLATLAACLGATNEHA